MQRNIIILFLSLLFTNCTFLAAKEVVEDNQKDNNKRIYNYQIPLPYSQKFLVQREKSFFGAGCFVQINIDRKKTALIANNEKMTFFVQPGKHIVGISTYKEDATFCSFSDMIIEKLVIVEENFTMKIDYKIAEEGFFIEISQGQETEVIKAADLNIIENIKTDYLLK